MNAQEQILNDLKDVLHSNGEVDLLNVYKGLPIVNKARVTELSLNSLKLSVHKQQAAALKYDPHPIILSSALREVAEGEVIKLDDELLTVTLHHLDYAGHRIHARSVVRVEPKDPIKAKINSGEKIYEFQIADVGLEGIGVAGAAAEWRPKRNTPIGIEFNLPNAHIKTIGTVRYMTQELNLNRIGFDFAHGTPVRSLINDYINLRREEILKELG